MSQLLVCAVCGAKIDIEDRGEPVIISELTIFEEEKPQEKILCDHCAQNRDLD